MSRDVFEKLPAGQFYGERVKSANVAGAELTEYRYSPGFAIPRHSHQIPYLAFVLQGTYTEKRGSLRLACRPSSVLFQSAGSVHSEEHDASVVRIFSIQLTAQFLQPISDYITLPSHPQTLRNAELTTIAHRLYREFSASDPLSSVAAEAYALEALVTISRSWLPRERRTPRWLATARDILHDHFPSVPSLAWIGREVEIHPAHVSRAFRQQFHCTITEYARKLRIERAQQMLANSEHSLSDVAAAVGYSEQSHFSTMFKRETGVSPGLFRRQFRKR